MLSFIMSLSIEASLCIFFLYFDYICIAVGDPVAANSSFSELAL